MPTNCCLIFLEHSEQLNLVGKRVKIECVNSPSIHQINFGNGISQHSIIAGAFVNASAQVLLAPSGFRTFQSTRTILSFRFNSVKNIDARIIASSHCLTVYIDTLGLTTFSSFKLDILNDTNLLNTQVSPQARMRDAISKGLN